MISNIELLKKLLLYSVAINIVVPFILKPFATEEEIKPPTGAGNLDLKGQIMHMFVHHAQVPLTSSIIVSVIVLLSVLIGNILCKII